MCTALCSAPPFVVHRALLQKVAQPQALTPFLKNNPMANKATNDKPLNIKYYGECAPPCVVHRLLWCTVLCCKRLHSPRP